MRDDLWAVPGRDGNNAIVNEYVRDLYLGRIGGLLNLKQDRQNYAYLYDGKGNVEAILDSAQNVVAAYRYDPFGVLLNKTGSLEQPFGFSTKRTDARTGMVFYQYRPYGPDSGTWYIRDPIGEAGGLNLYAFVGNNPVNWVDPDGLKPVGWLIRLTKTGIQKIRPLLSKKAAVIARKKGDNVILNTKQMAKAVEKAANYGDDILRHKGHELVDGTKGMSHFQTNGKRGHSFWGDISVLAIIGSLIDPFDAIKGELADEDELWANYGFNLDGTLINQECQ